MRADHTYDEELASKIHKELLKCNKNPNNPNEHGAKDLTLTKDKQMAGNPTKKLNTLRRSSRYMQVKCK